MDDGLEMDLFGITLLLDPMTDCVWCLVLVLVLQVWFIHHEQQRRDLDLLCELRGSRSTRSAGTHHVQSPTLLTWNV